jgi:membrane protein
VTSENPPVPAEGARLRTSSRFVHLHRFWRIAWDANITGQSAMIAYNMLLGVIPIALLGLFTAGQVLSSHSVAEITNSTTSTGVLALLASLWLGSSFWGALDTAFARVYGCPSRRWLEQKRFGLGMLIVVLVFMIATVIVPTAQSILRSGVAALPFDLAHVAVVVYAGSLAVGIGLLFGCLTVIYLRVPNRKVPWRAVWPGALAATIAIVIIDFGFPIYLSSISTIARFGTTIVFVLIMLGWFYVLALIILSGAIINALRLR